MSDPIPQPAVKLSDLPSGEMKEVTVDGRKVLLANVGGTVHAVAGTCPHYGAPLAEGTLCGSRLRCPWHQGCFDLPSGTLLAPPPLVDLQTYEVRVEGDEVFLTVPAGSEPYRDPAAAEPAGTTESRTFVILGAGAAGQMAAQTHREAGYAGRVILLSPEADLPYDRPALSKNYLAGQPLDHPLPLQPAEFYACHRIERVTGSATRLDPVARTVTLADGATLSYDALLIATGATPRTLEVPGASLPNVLQLRSLSDCDRILASAKPGTKAVLIGSGFIGMEAASALTQRGLSVTVISRDTVPFERTLGEPLGLMFRELHESHGVSFRLAAQVARFDGDAAVRSVTLASGERLDADLVIVALGVHPNTEFLRGSPIPLNDDGSLTTDRSMRVEGFDNLYAAGDLARFPSPQTGEPIRVEHWRVASQLGRIAALNMAGVSAAFDDPPYFWSFQFNVGLDYVGHGEGWDRTYINGNPSADSPDFLAFYLRLDEVIAVAGCNRSRQTNAIAELMRAGRMPSASEVRSQPVNWLERLAELS
jgi:NADPH-dependent 2,4-dienoyl-CoA reductase/sulfur reductase-like enzyme/nitrite reductase/ring-hydroxylating ferredoxin subunit